MKKIIFLIFAIFVAWLLAGYFYIPKINYTNDLLLKQKDRYERQQTKNLKLQKDIILFVKNIDFREEINLNLYKDYFILNWEYCDIEDNFFIWLERKLQEKNIIYKPKLKIETDDEKNIVKVWIKQLWKKLKIDNIKANICSFVKSDEKLHYIEIELENYSPNQQVLDDVKKYKLVWNYKIDKYFKTPDDSVLNSQNLIEKISNEMILENESISVLERLLDEKWKDLLISNILKDGEIIKWIWWGSCLASTIIYRTMLNAWIDIISQKTHNVYYQNIYWNWEIWLDSTIYEDEKYFVDLMFRNNYKNPIIFVPNFTQKSIELSVYSKEKEFNTKLTPVNLKDISWITWKYEVFDQENNKVLEKKLFSKYDRVDNF